MADIVMNILDDLKKNSGASANAGAPDVVMGILQDLRDNPLPEPTNIVEEAKRLDSIYRPQNLSTGYQPEWEKPLTMPDIPSTEGKAYPEDTLTEVQLPKWNTRDSVSNFVGGVTDALRQGVSNMVSGFKTAPSVQEQRTWLASLTDEEFRQAVQNGQVPLEDMGLTALPWVERAKALEEANTQSAWWNSRIDRAAEAIAPEPGNEPTSTLGQMGYKALEMVPGVLANLAKWRLLGAPGAVALNTLSGNEAAKEQAYAAQRAQGKTVPEAIDQSNSAAWNMADVLTRGGSEAAALWALGLPTTIGGAWNPVMQGLGHVGLGAGASGAGGALENIIGRLWGGQDVDAGEALKAGAESAAATGLMGLFNMAMKGRELFDKTKAHYQVKSNVEQYNNAVGKRGFTRITPEGKNGFSMEDSREQIENALLGGNIDPMEARNMLVEAGLGTEDEVTAGILQLMMKHGGWARGQGRGLAGQGTEAAPVNAPLLPASTMRQNTPVQQTPVARPQRSALEQVMGLGAGQETPALGTGTPKPQRPIPMGGTLRGDETIAVPETPAQPEQTPNALEQVLGVDKLKETEAKTPQTPPAQAAGTPVQEEAEITGVVDKKWGLPKGYEVEGAKNPRNLKGTKQHQFVLRNGNRDWGYVTEELAAGRPEVPVGPIRVTAGDRGFGLKHVHSKHLKDALADNKNVEEYISHVIDDGDEIIPLPLDDRGRQPEFLVAHREGKKTQDTIIIAWEKEGYYTLKTAFTPTTDYLEEQKKSLSSRGASSTPAPAPAPIPSATSQAKPESLNGRQHEGDNDNKETIPQPAAEVKEEPKPGTRALNVKVNSSRERRERNLVLQK